MKNFTPRHIVLAALCIAASQSQATPVNITFSGHVWTVSDPSNSLGLTQGTTYTTSFTYEDSTRDSNADPTKGTFNYALTNWTYTFGNGLVFNLDTSQLNSMNLVNHTDYSKIGITGQGLPAYSLSKYFFDFSAEFFYSGSPNVLSDIAPESGWRELSGAFINQIYAYDETNTQVLHIRTSTTGGYTVSSVPLPSAAWLFGYTLLAVAGIARRKVA